MTKVLYMFDDKFTKGDNAKPESESDPLHILDSKVKYTVGDNLLYGFTMRINSGTAEAIEYRKLIYQLEKAADVISWVFEDRTKSGRQTRLHVHGVCRLFSKRVRFGTLFRDGVHTRFENIYDEEGWNRYITKNL